MNPELLQRIENVYFRYYERRRGELAQAAPDASLEGTFRWDALSGLLDDTVPDAYHAIEFDESLAILLVIDGAAHIVCTSSTHATTTSVGHLDGGIYEEEISGGDKGEITGTFRHRHLRSHLIVRARRWEEDQAAQDVRDLFREWASKRRT